jgi:hypothetical protein
MRSLKSILFVAIFAVAAIAFYYYGSTLWDLIVNEIIAKQ